MFILEKSITYSIEVMSLMGKLKHELANANLQSIVTTPIMVKTLKIHKGLWTLFYKKYGLCSDSKIREFIICDLGLETKSYYKRVDKIVKELEEKAKQHE